MISVTGLGKHFGYQTLFEGVGFQLNSPNRYGLVGANGSGKSTFLRILTGEDQASDGSVGVPNRAKLGFLSQDHFQYEQSSIIAVVMQGNAELWEAMEEKEKLLANAEEEFDGDRYAELEDVVLRHDGYSFEARCAEILEGLGIPTEQHASTLSTLSGGFKLRVLLAQVLAANPDVLLLDEPTNHLDILSIRWLEKFLIAFPGCAVLISHDHRFLDNVATHILDVDYETITLYPGNYSAFLAGKVGNRERREAEIEKQEKKIAEHKAFVDRFRAKASKARQAQSKVKQIAKIKIEKLAVSSRRYPKFRFIPCRPSGKVVLKAEGICKAYGDNVVLNGVNLQIGRDDRLAIIGPNGIGKSTLLKIFMANVESDAGTTEWGYETHPGYFAQDHKETFGDSKADVESWLWDHCAAEPIGFVRSQLGRVLFSGDDAKKKVGSLSGGEAARLIFARLAVTQPNVLVLDEPTNHLDLEAIEALGEALESFAGTLVFVSHDRWFVSRLANRILEITPDGVQDFRGGYDEYLEKCGDDHLDADAVVLKVKREKKKAKARKNSNESPARRRTRLKKERDETTAEIEKAETRVNAINESFCDPTFFDRTTKKKVQAMEREQAELKARIDELMACWEELEADLLEADS